MVNISESNLATGTVDAVKSLLARKEVAGISAKTNLLAHSVHTGVNADRLRKLLDRAEPFTLLDLAGIAKYFKMDLNALTIKISARALDREYPPPAWAKDACRWAQDGGEWCRTNRTTFHESGGDGKTDLCVAVEQYETLGETPPAPVIDIYAQDQKLDSPVTWRQAMDMGKALIQASALLAELTDPEAHVEQP